MEKHLARDDDRTGSTRRGFLTGVGRTAVAGSLFGTLGGTSTGGAAAAPSVLAPTEDGRVGYRTLGRTGLRVSEIGFGGHSWSYGRVPDGKGGLRRVSIDEATEMIGLGMDLGVNFFDSCTPLEEASIPGEALKRLRRRDQAIVNIRVSHRMKGVAADKKEVFAWTEERLRLWQTDYVDICILANTANDTPQSGYWDMSYSIEALDRLKQQGKIRYTGFGCHFTPALFLQAFRQFGKDFDVCSMPYNVRHRAAEELVPEAKKVGLGVITIKPFARGSLLENRDLEGADANLPRDMIAFVLRQKEVDVCICGVHTVAQVKKNFSASWIKLAQEDNRRLDAFAAKSFVPCGRHDWLEKGWLHA